jgi:hypothetical protein
MCQPALTIASTGTLLRFDPWLQARSVIAVLDFEQATTLALPMEGSPRSVESVDACSDCALP